MLGNPNSPVIGADSEVSLVVVVDELAPFLTISTDVVVVGTAVVVVLVEGSGSITPPPPPPPPPLLPESLDVTAACVEVEVEEVEDVVLEELEVVEDDATVPCPTPTA